MSGERDASPLTDSRESAAVAALFGADVITLPDAGHCFMVEPAWRHSAERLRAWLHARNLAAAY